MLLFPSFAEMCGHRLLLLEHHHNQTSFTKRKPSCIYTAIINFSRFVICQTGAPFIVHTNIYWSRRNAQKIETGMFYSLYCPSSHCSSRTQWGWRRIMNMRRVSVSVVKKAVRRVTGVTWISWFSTVVVLVLRCSKRPAHSCAAINHTCLHWLDPNTPDHLDHNGPEPFECARGRQWNQWTESLCRRYLILWLLSNH